MANMQILAAQKRMKEKALADLEARGIALSTKRKELEERAEKVETEQDLTAVVTETDTNDGDIRENQEQQESLRTEIEDIDAQMADFEKRSGQVFKNTKKRGVHMSEEMEEKRTVINGYIRKRAAVDGITSTTAEVRYSVIRTYSIDFEEIQLVCELKAGDANG